MRTESSIQGTINWFYNNNSGVNWIGNTPHLECRNRRIMRSQLMQISNTIMDALARTWTSRLTCCGAMEGKGQHPTSRTRWGIESSGDLRALRFEQMHKGSPGPLGLMDLGRYWCKISLIEKIIYRCPYVYIGRNKFIVYCLSIGIKKNGADH